MSEAKGVIAKTFKVKTYNGISLTYDEQTDYVNISKAFRENNKQWNKYKLTKAWKEIEKYAEIRLKSGDWKVAENSPGPNNAIYYDVNIGSNEYRGIYIHPKLTHFVCQYVSIAYAFKVAELMDSINESVHIQLKQENKEDTPKNATPIFERKVNQCIVVQRNCELLDKQCWGYRDCVSSDRLDSWEQLDLKRDIEAYNEAKTSLEKSKKVFDKAREAVESWTTFVNQYFPRFKY